MQIDKHEGKALWSVSVCNEDDDERLIPEDEAVIEFDADELDPGQYDITIKAIYPNSNDHLFSAYCAWLYANRRAELEGKIQEQLYQDYISEGADFEYEQARDRAMGF